MFWKKSILAKILVGIIIPILIVFTLASVIILQQVKTSLTTTLEGELEAKSQVASSQVSEFFTKYTELVEQMSCNESILQMMREIQAPGTSATVPSYPTAAKSLDNILASDDKISLVWTADFDSGESIRSGGVIRGQLTDYDITTRDWYQQTLDAQKLFVTEPYEDSTTGELVASVICPVFDGSSIIGLVAIDITIDALKVMMGEYQLGQSGFFLLSTGGGSLIYHPNPELDGKNIEEAELSSNIVAAVDGQQDGNYVYTSAGAESHGYLSAVGSIGWTVVSGLPTEEFYSGYNAVQKQIFLVFGVGMLVMIVAIVFISKGIIRPIKKLSAAANAIADGNLNVSVDVTSVDETGQVSEALNRTISRLRDYINYIDEVSIVLNDIAKGNLTFELTYDYAGEFSKIKMALDNISDSLNDTLHSINQSSDEVSYGADQVSSGAQALSQGATEQASSTEELAATVNEISMQVKDTAANAADARQKTNTAAGEVTVCNQQMKEMIEAMAEISDKSNEIGKIIKTIEDIAFQTNILALNAAVEAARAGAAGKGFAVVADEVRNLANKSQEASQNTSGLIEGSIHAVQKGTKIANETAQSLFRVVDGTQAVAATVDKIAAAASEQAVSIAQVTQGIDQISSVVQTNSATAEESAAASEELSGQAQMLKESVGRFKLKNKN